MIKDFMLNQLYFIFIDVIQSYRAIYWLFIYSFYFQFHFFSFFSSSDRLNYIVNKSNDLLNIPIEFILSLLSICWFDFLFDFSTISFFSFFLHIETSNIWPYLFLSLGNSLEDDRNNTNNIYIYIKIKFFLSSDHCFICSFSLDFYS